MHNLTPLMTNTKPANSLPNGVGVVIVCERDNDDDEPDAANEVVFAFFAGLSASPSSTIVVSGVFVFDVVEVDDTAVVGTATTFIED